MLEVFVIAVFLAVIGFVSAFLKGLYTLLPNTIQRILLKVSNGIDELMKFFALILFPYIFGYIGHSWSMTWMVTGAFIGLIVGIGIRQAIGEQQTLNLTIRELQESKDIKIQHPASQDISDETGPATASKDSNDDYNEEYYAGQHDLQLGDYASAAVHFSAAITKDPNEALYYIELAECQNSLGDYLQAIESLSNAYRCDPTLHFINGSIAELRMEVKDYLGATIDYTTAIARISDEFKGAWYDSRAYALLLLGAYEKAIADYTTAILENPDNAEYIGRRGNAKVKLADYRGAITDFSRAEELNPQGGWQECVTATATQMALRGIPND